MVLLILYESDYNVMKSLFENTIVNNIKLKNRFIRSSTWLRRANEDGTVNEEMLAAYEELAQGGVGLIMTEYAFVTDEEQPNPKMLGAYDDRFIEGFEKIAKIIHQNNSKVALQIAYGGSQCTHQNAQEMKILGPFAVKNPYTGLTPKEADHNEIESLIKSFGDAAYRAKISGMDGVQIHAAHGYLLSQWLTPYFNRREDAYGGSIQNRARILYEIYEDIRRKTGKDFAVMIKINQDDLVTNNEGLTTDESIQVIEQLDKLGVDLIEISGGNTSLIGSVDRTARKGIFNRDRQSYFRDAAQRAAARMKRAKIALVGGNRDFGLMTELLNTTQIEYFSMSRPFLCEADLVNKWKQNTNYRMRCVACNQCWGKERNECIHRRAGNAGGEI